jgi:hypothetical protein
VGREGVDVAPVGEAGLDIHFSSGKRIASRAKYGMVLKFGGYECEITEEGGDGARGMGSGRNTGEIQT